MKKTITEWISTIRNEEARDKAYKNLYEFNIGKIYVHTRHSSLEYALTHAFLFKPTAEGELYWEHHSGIWSRMILNPIESFINSKKVELESAISERRYEDAHRITKEIGA